MQITQQLVEDIKSWMQKGGAREALQKFQEDFAAKQENAKQDLAECLIDLSTVKSDKSLSSLKSDAFFKALDAYLQKATNELAAPKDSDFPVTQQVVDQVKPLVSKARLLKAAIQDFNNFSANDSSVENFEAFLKWRNAQRSQSKK